MAVLKAINGHTGCGRIKDYLKKGGRALLRDFFNLSWDEVEDKGLDAVLKDEVDYESAIALAGSSWESLTLARELQPLQEIEVESEEEDWMDCEGD